MATTCVTESVVLRGGLSVPLPALQLLWDLESRDIDLRIDDDQLVVSPRLRITAADDKEIRRHRDALVALVRYCEAVQ